MEEFQELELLQELQDRGRRRREDILKEGRERWTFYKSQQHQITNVGMKGLTAEAKA